jgi:hypothetical protein
MEIVITDYRPASGKSLKAFVEIEFPEVGLRLKDVAYHKNHRKSWLQLPTLKFKRPDGSRGFNHIVDFTSKELYQEFQESASTALSAFHGEQRGVGYETTN